MYVYHMHLLSTLGDNRKIKILRFVRKIGCARKSVRNNNKRTTFTHLCWVANYGTMIVSKRYKSLIRHPLNEVGPLQVLQKHKSSSNLFGESNLQKWCSFLVSSLY